MHVNLHNRQCSSSREKPCTLPSTTTCFLSQVLTAIYPAQTMALTAGVIPVANMASAVAAAAQDIAGPSSPKATGMQNSVAAVPPSNAELESKVEVKREIQPGGPDEDDGYGYSSSTTNSSLATAGNSSTRNKNETHQWRICSILVC